MGGNSSHDYHETSTHCTGANGENCSTIENNNGVTTTFNNQNNVKSTNTNNNPDNNPDNQNNIKSYTDMSSSSPDSILIFDIIIILIILAIIYKYRHHILNFIIWLRMLFQKNNHTHLQMNNKPKKDKEMPESKKMEIKEAVESKKMEIKEAVESKIPEIKEHDYQNDAEYQLNRDLTKMQWESFNSEQQEEFMKQLSIVNEISARFHKNQKNLDPKNLRNSVIHYYDTLLKINNENIHKHISNNAVVNLMNDLQKYYNNNLSIDKHTDLLGALLQA